MRRILLTLAYDGTNYCGWQIQPNGLSVQAVLNHALEKLLAHPVRTIGASRTDAGVHALCNRVIFDTTARMEAERFAFALNTYLPEDVRCRGSVEVPEDFHPLRQRTVKTYEYRIFNAQFPDPTKRLYALFRYGALDLAAMRRAAQALVGTHDFTSFAAARKDGSDADAQDFPPEASDGEKPAGNVRTIYAADVVQEGGLIRILVQGDGFLYHMVRIIAGTLLEIGRGELPEAAIPEILAARDRTRAGATAPACGLTLTELRFLSQETGDASGL